MTDPLSDVLVAIIAVCAYPLLVLVPRDPLLRRMSTRRAVRRQRKGLH